MRMAMNGKDRFYLSQPEHRGWIDEPLYAGQSVLDSIMAMEWQSQARESLGTQQWMSRSTCEPLGGWITGVTQ
ncbi:hypothetical protein IPC744_15080 [Pseudomonas aeruginosa]|nr:hypothetical protein AO902_07700 [Pseudomonas aeruginosa]RPM81203.1 hypothetical protein IPC1280_21365 [Pseudomonas aeruginosa]RPS01057.1 hypothetical protein IPC1020_23785 [Pseudomonas aeruginosa]RPW00169.1 hypothetical protein IPC776_21755 [Pseudomonas aeruginosa]RPW65291.1 hypothetical protein IPC744_15080 [Pseudomonas aeruginosa]